MRILALPAFKNRRENPYTASLYTALGTLPDVNVAEFTNRRVFCERWDILHIHWPDAPLHRPTALRAAFAALFFIIRVVWARLLGARIVWTVHNLRSHQAEHPAVEKLLWRAFIPLVDSCIHLSRSGRDLALESFTLLRSKSHAVVPHGDYRNSYGDEWGRLESRFHLGIPAGAPVIGFIGQIKPYKNVPELISAFLEAGHPHAWLLIAGRPADGTMAADIRAAVRNHPRVLCHFGLIPDERMHLYLSACDLTVFPYRDILNSGSAILSLSFNRPTLVPARGAMSELQEMAGPEWVHTYDGPLTGAILSQTLDDAVDASGLAQCELSALSWQSIGSKTFATYLAALGRAPLACTQTALASVQ